MSANRKTASRRSLRNPTDLFGSGGCESSRALLRPAISKEAEAGKAAQHEEPRRREWSGAHVCCAEDLERLGSNCTSNIVSCRRGAIILVPKIETAVSKNSVLQHQIVCASRKGDVACREGLTGKVRIRCVFVQPQRRPLSVVSPIGDKISAPQHAKAS
jgi:hypothetical protein